MHLSSRSLQPGTFLLRGMIWLFVGVIFALVFVLLTEFLRDVLPSPIHLLVATVGAGSLTALFYGSMRLTVIVANILFITTLAYVFSISYVDKVSLLPLITGGALLGMVIGAYYGWKDKGSRIFCADAKIVAGVVAGSISAVIVVVPVWLIFGLEQTVYPWLVMAIAPVTGQLYVLSAYWFVERCQHLLSPVGDGAVVGLGVGAVTQLVFVIMASSLDSNIVGLAEPSPYLERVKDVLVLSMLGAALSCFVLGMLRTAFRARWYDL